MKMIDRPLAKADFETLAEFRYRLRRFLRFSKEVTHSRGITPLQYLLLHIKGFPGLDWATVGEFAERLQGKHHGVVSLISRCERLGLVKRRPGASDRRRVEVRLSPSLVVTDCLGMTRTETGPLLLATCRKTAAVIRCRGAGDRASGFVMFASKPAPAGGCRRNRLLHSCHSRRMMTKRATAPAWSVGI